MLRKWLLKFIQGLDWLDRGITYSWFLLFAATFLVTWEVIMRYVFYSAHDWFEEVIVCVCLAATLLGSGRTTKTGSHILLELLYVRLKGRKRRVADIVNNVVVIVASGILVVCLLQWTRFLNLMGMTYASSLHTPLSVVSYILAAGMTLNALYSLERLLRAWLEAPGVKGEGEVHGPEAKY